MFPYPHKKSLHSADYCTIENLPRCIDSPYKEVKALLQMDANVSGVKRLNRVKAVHVIPNILCTKQDWLWIHKSATLCPVDRKRQRKQTLSDRTLTACGVLVLPRSQKGGSALFITTGDKEILYMEKEMSSWFKYTAK